MDQQMDLFFEEIINKAGLTSLSQEFKAGLKDKLYQQLIERLGLRALQELPDDKGEEYKKLVADETSQEKLGLFLQQNVPDFENFLKTIMVKFGQDFVDTTTKGKTAN